MANAPRSITNCTFSIIMGGVLSLLVLPSLVSADDFLPENFTRSQLVEYEKKLEYKDEAGNKRFYGLFKELISKYGGRNPRQINRLINGSLIRGAGAERIVK